MIKNSVIYLMSSIVSKSTPFLLLPILTSHLQVFEFGLLSIILVMNLVYGALVGMAMHTNVSKNFYSKSKNEFALMVGNVFLVLLIMCVVLFTLTLVFSYFKSSLFSIPSKYMLILPVAALLSMVNQLYLTILRCEGKAYTFGVCEVLNALLILVMTIVLLYFTDVGWLSHLVGIVFASLVLGVIGIVYIVRKEYFYFRYQKREIISIMSLSVPLIPHVLGGVVITVSDRLFIETLIGAEAVALYTVGYSFGKLVSLFVDAFIKAWSPWFYKVLSTDDSGHKISIVKYTYVYIAVVFLLAIFLSFFSYFVIPFFVSDPYIGSRNYVIWVALGYAIQGIYKIFFPYLVFLSKTYYLAFSSTIAALANIVLNYYFIRLFGAVGAAYATIVAFSISGVMVFLYQLKHIHMPWGVVFRKL